MPPEVLPAPKPSFNKLIFIVLLLGLVASAVSVYLDRARYELAWSALTMPTELKSAIFLGPNGVVSPTHFGYTFTQSPVPFIAYAKNAQHIAYLTIQNGAPPMMTAVVDGKPVLTSMNFKAGLVLAPGASTIAFSETVAQPARGPLLTAPSTQARQAAIKASLEKALLAGPPAPATVNLIILSSKQSSVTKEGGFAPQFIDATHLLWLSGKGIMMSDISQASSSDMLVLADPFPTVGYITTYSSTDSMLVVVDTIKGQATTFKVNGMTLEKISDFSVGQTSSVALHNGRLYVLTQTKQESAITWYTPDGKKGNTFTFPSIVHVNSLYF